MQINIFKELNNFVQETNKKLIIKKIKLDQVNNGKIKIQFKNHFHFRKKIN